MFTRANTTYQTNEKVTGHPGLGPLQYRQPQERFNREPAAIVSGDTEGRLIGP